MSLPHRCLFLSDVHLGTGRTRARALWTLLQREPSERVVLVGDILDLTSWQQRQPRFSKAEWQVLQWLLQRHRAGELVWLLGNHEQPLRDWLGTSAACSWISEQLTYTSLHGQRLLVTHGDQLDCQAISFNRGEEFAIRLFHRLESQHLRWNLKLPSPSALAMGTASGRRLISRFHSAQLEAARQAGVDGIICGHSHGAALEQRDGLLLINTGCWTHPPGTVVVETACGSWELLDGNGGRQQWHPETASGHTNVSSVRADQL